MERQTVMLIRELLNNVFEQGLEQEVKDRFAFQVGSCKYDPHAGTATFKLEIVDKDVSGGAESVGAAYFKRNCHLYGFKESDLNKRFYWNGNFYTLDGMSRKSRKYPMEVTRVGDGKRFRLTEQSVRSGINAFKSKA